MGPARSASIVPGGATATTDTRPVIGESENEKAPGRAPFLELQGMRLDQSQSLPRQGLIFHGVIASIRHCSQ